MKIQSPVIEICEGNKQTFVYRNKNGLDCVRKYENGIMRSTTRTDETGHIHEGAFKDPSGTLTGSISTNYSRDYHYSTYYDANKRPMACELIIRNEMDSGFGTSPYQPGERFYYEMELNGQSTPLQQFNKTGQEATAPLFTPANIAQSLRL